MSACDSITLPYILRAELRLTKKVKQQVGQPVVGGHLASAALYRRLGDLWLSHFETIEFERVLRITAPATIPELRDSLALQAMEAHGGPEAMIKAIDAARRAGLIDSVPASRQRSWVRNLATHPSLTEEADISDEFREAIRAVHSATLDFRPS